MHKKGENDMLQMTKTRKKDAIEAYAMLLPAAILLILFMLWPMINSVYYGLFKWNLVGDKVFVGLDNFRFMFLQDKSFQRALFNTVGYTVLNMLLTLTLSLGCALLFEKTNKLSVAGRCIAFIPVVVPITVMGMVWKMIYEPQFGIINQAVSALGGQGPQWLYDSNIALVAVVIFNVWKEFGLYTIIFIGGLHKIPKELYESASIDGSGPWRTFWTITLPMLRPIMYFATTILLINSFKAFDHIWVMTGGGPGNATTTLVTYIYSKVFDNVGLASAASFVLFAIVLLITLIKAHVGKDGEVDA
jgi:ABC-type sugar transport system permease subunit